MDYSFILMLCGEQMHADFSFKIPFGFILNDYQAILMECADEMGIDS